MDRFLAVLVIGALASCNNNATSAEKTVDSLANATVDSLKSTLDSINNAVDSTRMK